MSEDSVAACDGQMTKALWALSVGRAALPARLADAAFCVVMLEPKDFPADLRIRFARIREAVTAAGSYEETVARMSVERAHDIASDIYDLGMEVVRRYSIETEHD